MEQFRPVWANIDLGALQRNYVRLAQYTKSEIMPVVKANAYGHGVIPVVRTLRAAGAKRFGVALLEEALEIKAAFPDLGLMVLGVTPPEASDRMVREEIIPEICCLENAQALSRAAVAQGKTATLHIKVDTGMGRVGFRPDETEDILRTAALPGLFIEGIYMHFATADDSDLTFAKEQLELFHALCRTLQEQGLHIPIRHAANSAAFIQLPESHLELVRPGAIMYGLPPSSVIGYAAGVEPALSWKAKITHLKMIKSGETVSYGRSFEAVAPTRVATIPLGYADGLRRSLSNKGQVLLRGKRVRIIGRVCMDQTMLDVTEVPDAAVGDTVTLLGCDGEEHIDAAELGEKMDTINYEVLCGISLRVPRIYHEACEKNPK